MDILQYNRLYAKSDIQYLVPCKKRKVVIGAGKFSYYKKLMLLR